jgi:hypothetical protein
MESKLSEFGMGCLECNPKRNPKVVKFHAVAPKINQQRHRHQCCIIFFSPLTCAWSFYLQNLTSYLTWISKYGPLYITYHGVVGIH